MSPDLAHATAVRVFNELAEDYPGIPLREVGSSFSAGLAKLIGLPPTTDSLNHRPRVTPGDARSALEAALDEANVPGTDRLAVFHAFDRELVKRQK